MMSFDNQLMYKLDLEEPQNQLLQWAKENIGEDPDTKCKIISDLRDMIYATGECEPHRVDDEFLLQFLRARHFSVKKAHRLFVNYHDFKEDNPNFFKNVNLSYLKRMGDDNLITIPPHREDTGRRMMIYRLGGWNPEKFSVDQIFQATMAIMEIAIMEQQAQILGGICIFDFAEISMHQALHMTPSIARKIIQIMVTTFPLRIYALHIVNQSYVFDVIFNIFKPFLNEKMKARIHFHGNAFESLHKHISPKYLLRRYGGVHSDYDYNEWIEYFKKNKAVLKVLHNLGYEDLEGELDEEIIRDIKKIAF